MAIVLFLLGLVIGSFLGALTYRLPRSVSVNEGRSKCPNCGEQIAWYDNFPVISFFVLAGRCRRCNNPISVRYPLIEAVTAVVFVLVGFNIVSLLIASILIAIFVIDLEHQIIPDELVFAGLFILIGYNIFHTTYYSNLLAGFLAADLLLFLNLITKGKGMGLGDVKLALLIGSIVGLDLLAVWFFFSFVTGAIVGVMLIMGKRATMKAKIPFGPFLIIGLVLTAFLGKAFLQLI